MSKHTPGPWSAYRGSAWRADGEHFYFLEANRKNRHTPVALLTSDRRIAAESDANARLIAAAPEMLELLKRMDQIKGEPNDFDVADWLFDLRALIAKVEGDR